MWLAGLVKGSEAGRMAITPKDVRVPRLSSAKPIFSPPDRRPSTASSTDATTAVD
jgi:hypothetical protein